MSQIKENKCKKHGVVHRNGGYPSCPKENNKEEKGWIDNIKGIIMKHTRAVSSTMWHDIHFLATVEELSKYISKQISQAEATARREMAEEFEKMKVKEKDIRRFDNDPLHPVRAYKVGYNNAIDDIITLITKEK